MPEVSQIDLRPIYEQAHQYLRYADGRLYWRIRPPSNRTVAAGDLVGGRHNTGYWRLKLRGREWLQHRLIWLMHHGTLPKELDHIDGDSENNRIENLRACSRAENHCNARPKKRGASPYKGVFRSRDRWQAAVTLRGVKQHLGVYETQEEAAAAYNKAAKKLHGAFHRPNVLGEGSCQKSPP